jgi:putative hemolysin
MAALEALERLRQTRTHIALVIDEYGGVEGLVTLTDFVEAILGDVPDMGEVQHEDVVRREDGSYLLDGMLPIDRFQELFEIRDLPEENEGYYQTVGGFVMTMLGRVPNAGDVFDWNDLRVEVMDMDGRRVDKVLVVREGKSTVVAPVIVQSSQFALFEIANYHFCSLSSLDVFGLVHL